MGKNKAGKGITSRQQAIKAAKPEETRPTRRGAQGKLVGKAEADALSGGKRKQRGTGGAGRRAGYTPGARKQRRRDERDERRRAKLESDSSKPTANGRKRTFLNAQLGATDGGGHTGERDGEWRKDVRKQRLNMQRCINMVVVERERLEAYIAPEIEAEIVAREKKEHKRLQSIHPVARKLEIEGNPALGYVDPGSGNCIVRLARPPAEDLFETTPPGGFASREMTAPFLELLRDASNGCRQANKPEEAVAYMRELEKLDSADKMDVRPALVVALLDANTDGDGAALASEILDRHPKDQRTQMQYSRALIEYIGWRLLEEEGCTEESANAALAIAVAANPFAAIFLAHGDAFVKFVDPMEVDAKIGAGGASLNQGVVEEAFRYGVDGLSCWRDADGAAEWVLQHLPAPLPEPVGSDHAGYWVGVYKQALDHAMEAAMIAMMGGGDDKDGAEEDENAGEPTPVFAEDGFLIGMESKARGQDELYSAEEDSASGDEDDDEENEGDISDDDQ